MRRLAPAIVALTLLAGCAIAPGRPIDVAPLNHLPALAGDYFRFESRETGRDFHIHVRLPDPAAPTVWPPPMPPRPIGAA